MADPKPSTYAPNVYHAWAHLQTEVNRNLPTVIKAIRKADRAAYASLRRRGRGRH